MGLRMLYRGCDISSRPSDANTGLWYDKFANKWPSVDALRVKQDDESGRFDKLEWIQTVTGKTGDQTLIQNQVLRRSLLLNCIEASTVYFKNAGPFVTGLGRSHPVENGFAWHHTQGTAYLPGSSVKGMVRDWAVNWAQVDPEMLLRIFGSTNDNRNTNRRVGSVLFWDALPIAPLMLEADIMTVHYDDYYQAQKVPGDWLSPTPIPFLVVAAGQGFQFAISPGNPAHGSIEDCEHVVTWMTQALENIGAGAKTASGYGRFEPDDGLATTMASRVNARVTAQQQERERAEQVARMADASAAAKELMEDIVANDWNNNRDKFLAPGRLEGWIDKLVSDPQEDAIALLMGLAMKHLPSGLLANPEATNAKKKAKFSDRQQKIAKALNRLKNA